VRSPLNFWDDGEEHSWRLSITLVSIQSGKGLYLRCLWLFLMGLREAQ